MCGCVQVYVGTCLCTCVSMHMCVLCMCRSDQLQVLFLRGCLPSLLRQGFSRPGT